MSQDKGKAMQHLHSNCQQMKTSQRLWQAFVVASQTAKARYPGKRAFYDPATWQEYQAASDFRQPDHLQAYPLLCGLLRRLFPGVALVPKDHPNMLALLCLHCLGLYPDPLTILLISRCDMQGQQVRQAIDRQQKT